MTVMTLMVVRVLLMMCIPLAMTKMVLSVLGIPMVTLYMAEVVTVYKAMTLIALADHHDASTRVSSDFYLW